MEVRSTPCAAHSSRTGEPCKRWAILGGTVCPTHGGSIQRVKVSAEDRLAEMVDPALDTLHALLAADSEDVRLRTVKDILDRNGLKAADKVDINARLSFGQMSDDELERHIAQLQGNSRSAGRGARGTTAA